MKKIILVFGTRPEAIKMAPLVKELEKYPDEFQTIVCVTGQHREMLDQVLHLFEIKPEYDLNIMKQGQTLFDITSRVLCEFGKVLQKERPDLVLVHGDTTTSMSAALASFYEQIPVGHVEAGLRTGNIYSPWPEEMNRLITGRISVLDFAPTQFGRNNLLKENVPDKCITVTGNTVIDALYYVVGRIDSDSASRESLENGISELGYDIGRLDDRNRRMVLITGHRRENFGDGFHNICRALDTLSHKYPDVDFVYPMHLNPNVRKPIHEMFDGRLPENLFFIEPLDYFYFVLLMKRCSIVLTDSGGIQEEAPGLGKPVIVMRDTTERPEAVEAGTVKLVGTDYERIVHEISKLLEDQAYYQAMSEAVNPYGDGYACGRIVDFIRNYFQ